jgi:hypothetical protein
MIAQSQNSQLTLPAPVIYQSGCSDLFSFLMLLQLNLVEVFDDLTQKVSSVPNLGEGRNIASRFRSNLVNHLL